MTRHAFILLLLGLTSMMFTSGGRAGSSKVDPVQSHGIAVTLGEADSDILRRLPSLDLQNIVAAETADDVPRLVLVETPDNDRVTPADDARLNAMLSGFHAPDTALIFSGEWYGQRLHDAAQRLGLSLNTQRLENLETVAVARGVNTRWLLLLASLKRDQVLALTDADWIGWLFLESWRMRSALFHVDEPSVQHVRLRDGDVVAPAVQSGPAWALFASLSAGATPAETEQALSMFGEQYTNVFGDVSIDEAQPAAITPFLYRPYSVALNGRAYFDHSFPTVDYGGQPNLAGMVDYLGRTNTNYDTHDADDLWMPFGSPVLAPVAGTVLWVDSVGPDYGLLIRPPGTTYDVVIVHLSEVWLTTNIVVTRGQQIGRSGQSGSSRPIPHIHVEVRHSGRQTDSRGWYGLGPDPCSASGSSGRYGGCEAGVWLWADEAPPDTMPTPTQLPECSVGATTEQVSGSLSASLPGQMRRVLFPMVFISSSCQSP